MPVGIAALTTAWIRVPHTRSHAETRLPGLAGVAVLILTIAALALGLIQGPNRNGHHKASFLASAVPA